MELAKVDAFVGGDVIQVWGLDTTHGFGIGVVQNPLVVLKVGQVTTVIEHAMTDLLDDAAVFVLEEEVAPLLVAKPILGLGEDVRGIAPDEVRSVAVGNDDA